MIPPRTTGFYWAEWIRADRDTKYASELAPSTDWDVVYVFENALHKSEGAPFRVLVTGVEESQSIEDFEWGTGPLTPPQ
jgi:hypothetical protein